jgi:hypothetical protein
MSKGPGAGTSTQPTRDTAQLGRRHDGSRRQTRSSHTESCNRRNEISDFDVRSGDASISVVHNVLLYLCTLRIGHAPIPNVITVRCRLDDKPRIFHLLGKWTDVNQAACDERAIRLFRLDST